MVGQFSALIVDDDKIVRIVHKRLLSKCGFNVSVVEDGKKAVDQFDTGKSYDVVFMDMEMPVMDGPQATREIRKMGVNSMIIGVTSREQDFEQEEFMGAGLNCCYVKPLTEQIIDSILQKLKNK